MDLIWKKIHYRLKSVYPESLYRVLTINILLVLIQFSIFPFSIQFFMQIIILTVLGSNLFLVFEIVNSEIEKALSDRTDITWITK